MQSLIILHSNDIHGRIEGLARIATMVEQIRMEAHTETPVLYVDGGDIEETTTRLSNLTKGVAMYRLMTVAGCDVGTIGNGGLMRYGYQILPDYANAAGYPLVLSNILLPDHTPVPGALSTVILHAGPLKLGFIGLTANVENTYDTFFGLTVPSPVAQVKELAAKLRQESADIVILLSHMGLMDDRLLAQNLQDDVALIIGAHSHNLLPEGEQIGRVLVAQAGQYAQHLGRIDLQWDGAQIQIKQVAVMPVMETTLPAPKVMNVVEKLEAEAELFLKGIVGELAEALDFASDRECGVANLMADVLRERMQAEVAVVTAGQAFTGPLPEGQVHRVELWDVCSSAANPGVTTMTGAQLLTVITRGLSLSFAKERPQAMRGKERGLLHLSGGSIRDGQLLIGEKPVESERVYRVAGSDWELESYGGYIDPRWNLQVHYDVPTIMREALEEYLSKRGPIHVEMGRLG